MRKRAKQIKLDIFVIAICQEGNESLLKSENKVLNQRKAFC